MTAPLTPYGIATKVPLPYPIAVASTREQLGREGFGVITEIDVSATLRQKLGVEFRPYIILGACNPTLAYEALSAERDIGLLLPCNVIVYAADEPGQSVIAAMDPVTTMHATDNPKVQATALEVRLRLKRVLDALAAPGSAA